MKIVNSHYRVEILQFFSILGSYSELWICPKKCGKKYKQKNGLTQHLRYECGVPKQFFCTVCNKGFARKDSCRSHMGIIHKMIVH